MILSVSRRTDIPAFYGEWFIHRLKEGCVLIRNPINPRQVRRIQFERGPGGLEGVVFWSKNPRPFMRFLPELTDLPFYFLFTLNPYGPELERNLPPKTEVLETFRRLSGEVGAERVIWRYDPVILTPEMDESRHRRWFETLVGELSGHTRRCFFSFVSMYKKCLRAMRGLEVREPGAEERERLAVFFRDAAASAGVTLFSCADPEGFASAGIPRGRCIDADLLGRIAGRRLKSRKDPGQRKECGCCESIDIGVYNTCPHFCLYCYANSDGAAAGEALRRHDPGAPMLVGGVSPRDVVSVRYFPSRGEHPPLFPPGECAV